jgi:hypothetical protein
MVLDSFNINNENCSSEYIVLRKYNNEKLKYKRKELEGEMILFNPDKDPVISWAISFERDQALDCFDKNKQVE